MKKLLILAFLGFASFAFAEPAAFKKCVACHGADAKKVAPGSKGDVTIAGMAKDELVKKLKGYRAKTENNGGAAAVMYGQAASLTDDDIEALADHISKLPK
ncbi:MAG: c-type cytochrome [Helicobacter sp.]|uniref:c-type cytochrome n=1 Tax=Helicobacter sp. TaxID=218 RepID=UPI0025C0121E|nr:c-type cytochrome [Helicobacter sp.]MCH5312785.1 c-type cytochrome [Helicobacter sp.]